MMKSLTSARLLAGVTLSSLTEGRPYLRDRLPVVDEVDRGHPERLGRLAVDLRVVDEDALLGRDPVKARDRQLVDLVVRLAHADEGRVDDGLEDLVDGELRPPERLPLPDVVRQH